MIIENPLYVKEDSFHSYVYYLPIQNTSNEIMKNSSYIHLRLSFDIMC